jgi:hypothetical protein
MIEELTSRGLECHGPVGANRCVAGYSDTGHIAISLNGEQAKNEEDCWEESREAHVKVGFAGSEFAGGVLAFISLFILAATVLGASCTSRIALTQTRLACMFYFWYFLLVATPL